MQLVSWMRQAAQTRAPQMAALSRAVWEFAEPGYQETQSAAVLKQALREAGFDVQEELGGISTAFAARWGKGGPVIGILAEYDALPGLSQEAGVACRSPRPGQSCGHGCGHNLLGAGAVGAALLARDYLQAHACPGTVVLYGCPAEETGFGKAFLVRAGCFSGLDAALSWHPGDHNGALADRWAAYYKVRFSFSGRSAHAAAAPQEGRSALDACELMNVGVNYLREHIPDGARVHYAYLDCGGDAPNIVPNHAALLYFVRASCLQEAGEILNRVKDIARGAAMMTGTTVDIRVLGGISDTVPNPTVSRLLSEAFCAMGAPDFDKEEFALAQKFWQTLSADEADSLAQRYAACCGLTLREFADRPLDTAVLPYTDAMRNCRNAASTDVGDVSYQVPTGQLMAAAGIPGTGLHTWQMTAQAGSSIGEKAAVAAARAMALACAWIWQQPDLVRQAREELLAETGGRYLSPLPEDVQPGETGERSEAK